MADSDAFPSRNRRFLELDGLRAIAAFGVVCWHYINAFGSAPFTSALALFYRRGLLMVDLFFVLSGFVLAHAFWRTGTSESFVRNVVTRIGRLYPLHLCTLITVASMQWFLASPLGQDAFVYSHNDGYHLVLNLILLQSSGLEKGFSFNAPSWSISTEFLINLLFLALVTLPRKTAILLMSLFTVGAIITLAHRGVLNGTRALGWIDNGLVRTVAGFFIGVLTYRIKQRVYGSPSVIADFSCVLLCGSITWYLASPSYCQTAGDLAVCLIGFPLLILSVLSSTVIAVPLRLPPILYFGKISYSVYLIHFPLQLSVHILAVLFGWVIPFASPFCFCGFMSAVLMFSSLAYRLVELPGKRIIRTMVVRAHIPAAAGTARMKDIDRTLI